MNEINYELVVNELKKISKDTESKTDRPPTSTVQIIGELLVLKELYTLGLNPIYQSGTRSADIILDDKRIEVKTSHVYEFNKRIGKVAENANINPDKFDFLVFVVSPEDWGEERFFILKSEEVGKIEHKRLFGVKGNLKQIVFYAHPKNDKENRNNDLLKEHEDKWEKIIKE